MEIRSLFGAVFISILLIATKYTYSIFVKKRELTEKPRKFEESLDLGQYFRVCCVSIAEDMRI